MADVKSAQNRLSEPQAVHKWVQAAAVDDVDTLQQLWTSGSITAELVDAVDERHHLTFGTDRIFMPRRTALMIAVCRNCFRAVRWLLQTAKADVNHLVDYAAVHVATITGDIPMLELLLANGADVNARDELEARTAMHYAALGSCSRVVHILLRHGANPRQPDTCGVLAADLAINRGFPFMAALVSCVSWLYYLQRHPAYEKIHRTMISSDRTSLFSMMPQAHPSMAAHPVVDLDEVDFRLTEQKGFDVVTDDPLAVSAYSKWGGWAAAVSALPDFETELQHNLQMKQMLAKLDLMDCVPRGASIVDLMSAFTGCGFSVADLSFLDSPLLDGITVALYGYLPNPSTEPEQLPVLDTAPSMSAALSRVAYCARAVPQAVSYLLGVLSFENSELEAAIIDAASFGHLAVLTVLLDYWDTRGQPQSQLAQAVQQAVMLNRTTSVRTLLSRYPALVSTRDGLEVMPLCCAVACGHISMTRLLLERGAETGNSNDGPLSILHYGTTAPVAADMLKLLLEHPGVPDLLSLPRHAQEQTTPLHLAAFNSDAAAVAVLLETERVGVEVTDYDGQTSLHVAAMQGDVATFRALLDHAPPQTIDAVTNRGQTALLLAVQNGWSEVAQMLLHAGASLTAYAFHQPTPLCAAVALGDIPFVKLLLQHDPSVISVGSPLTVAVRGEDPAMINLLLDAGADINATNAQNMSALNLALTLNLPGVLDLLLQRGADTKSLGPRPPVHHAVSCGSVESLAVLLRHGADVNASDGLGLTALHEAVCTGRGEIAEALLAVPGIDVNAQRRFDGYTPLHIAAQQGSLPLIRQLVERGANRSITCLKGLNPLQIAERKGFATIQAMLCASAAVAPPTSSTDTQPTENHKDDDGSSIDFLA